jgi:hypothetical protein
VIESRCAFWLACVSNHGVVEIYAAFQAHAGKSRSGSPVLAELLETYRPRPTPAIPHGQEISQRILASFASLYVSSRQHAGRRTRIRVPMRLRGDVFGDKDTRRFQVEIVSLSGCRKASKSDAFRATPPPLRGKLAVTWRVPGQRKRDTFP